MRTSVTVIALSLSIQAVLAESALNQLTAEEQASGWRLLFDGKSLTGWRGFKKEKPPEQGWIVEEGVLKKVANVRGGDIVSIDKFSDFELQWEWKVPPRANNGIKYFITEERGSAIGHEYQMIDEGSAKISKHSTASFYDVLPPNNLDTLKPTGQWNQSRVIVRGNKVEHWLNGAKVLDYTLGSEELKAAIAKSKFKDVPGFGTKLKGHILLTDHKDEAWFRNIKIRAVQ